MGWRNLQYLCRIRGGGERWIRLVALWGEYRRIGERVGRCGGMNGVKWNTTESKHWRMGGSQWRCGRHLNGEKRRARDGGWQRLTFVHKRINENINVAAGTDKFPPAPCGTTPSFFGNNLSNESKVLQSVGLLFSVNAFMWFSPSLPAVYLLFNWQQCKQDF